MTNRPSVLCPIDFSDPSRGALRYAAALAEHFYATLYVLTVDDPFLVQAATVSFGQGALKHLTEEALQSFISSAFPGGVPKVASLERLIRVGEPAPQILRAAAAVNADVIVMSTHGASGIRKRLFGATTERVLRTTSVPVVVTPGEDPGPENLEEWTQGATSVVVPVDLSEYSAPQLRVAQGLAEGLRAGLVVAHVLEPLAARDYFRSMTAAVDAARHSNAALRLNELLRAEPAGVRRTTEIAYGDPSTEIARLAREHGAKAIVMALHSSPATGRRIGSVTYRLLCQTPAVVVALPPAAAGPLPVARGAADVAATR